MTKQLKDKVGLTQQVRIIGGTWRGRKLHFPDRAAIRPTPDRVRETLFNWLAEPIVGAHCIDPFAGSGALGLEALSRGAASVVFIDNDHEVIAHIQKHLTLFQCDKAQCHVARVPTTTLKLPQTLDLIFLDPPFSSDLILPTVSWLTPFCHAGTYLYLETDSASTRAALPDSWQTLKAKHAGHVHYSLMRYHPETDTFPSHPPHSPVKGDS